MGLRRLREGFGTKRCNYVQAFLLSKTGKIIKDILLVFRGGHPILMPNSKAHVKPMERSLRGNTILMPNSKAPFMPMEQSLSGNTILMPNSKAPFMPMEQSLSEARRQSSRIRDRSHQSSGKKSVTTGFEAAKFKDSSSRNLRDKKKAGSLTIISEAESMLDAGICKPSGKEPVEKTASLSSAAKSMIDAGSRKLSGKEPVEPMSLAILYDDVMLGHKATHYCLGDDIRMMYRKTMLDHEEKPARIKCIMDRFIKDDLFARAAHVRHDFADVKDILAMHRDVYVEFIQSLPLTAEANRKYMGFFTRDVYCSKGTRDAVFSAAGANIKACDMVFRDQFKKAFAVVRPPGHHVSKDEAEGFCFVNNIAIGASFLLHHHKVKRIMVIDWDVHHGNGTQELFYESDEVLFFSTFNMDLNYPRSSKQGPECIGKGKGAGFNVNVPLQSGFGNSDMLYVWKELLIPLLKKFNPEMTLISCGFDAAQGDPLGRANVTPPCFATLLDMVDKAGNGKIVLTLEGGYDLPILAECSSCCARALVGDSTALLDDNSELGPLCKGTMEAVSSLKQYLSMFWLDVFKKLRLCAKK